MSKRKSSPAVSNTQPRPISPVLKVFEAFSGIGAQNAALKSLGMNYKVVGTSDWFVNAVIAYDALHSDKSFDDFYDPNAAHTDVREYCKREECWKKISSIPYELSDDIMEGLKG